jgi:excinuclease ABC subunit C
MTHSILDEIPGVGGKRRVSLLKHFKSIDAIQQAPIEEIEAVENIPKNVAISIYKYFHKKE